MIHDSKIVTKTETNDSQDEYAYFLHNIPGIGNKSIFALLSIGKQPKIVYEFTEKEIKQILSSERLAKNFIKVKESWDITKQYRSLQEKQIKFYHVNHPLFPKRLNEIPDKPYGIYVKGTLPQEHKPAIAIIGARICSDYGRYMARQFGMTLAAAGLPIISGLARGVDGISQKAAIEAGGTTFGVLGCGVDICYPEENRNIYNAMDKMGGIIAEYVPGTLPKPGHFPVRNRIISGLSDIVLVIEAKEKSGTLITVDMALEQGREVYALPGRVTDAVSFGCNNLIRQGAGIALSPGQLLQELENYGYQHKTEPENRIYENSSSNKSRLEILTKDEMLLYEHLDITPKSIDEILGGIPELITIPMAIDILLSLTMKGVAKSIGSNRFVKIVRN